MVHGGRAQFEKIDGCEIERIDNRLAPGKVGGGGDQPVVDLTQLAG